MVGCGRLLLCGFHSLCVDKRVFQIYFIIILLDEKYFYWFFFFFLTLLFMDPIFITSTMKWLVFPLKLPLTLKMIELCDLG